MRRYTEAQILRLGAITLVVMLLIMAASFNLSKFPGFSGDTYRAEFTDASGIRSGNIVQVGGIRVGRVEEVELEGAKVVVTFEVDKDVEFGTESQASIEVLNLLGEKYLQLTPAGSGQLDEDDVIPVSRTESAYDIVGVFGDLATTTERIDTGQLKQALNVVSDTMDTVGPAGPGRASRASPGCRRRSPRATRRSSRCSRAPAASADAGRPERRHRAADGPQRPGLPGDRAPQGGHPPVAGQRADPGRRAARPGRDNQARSVPPCRRSTTSSTC